MSSLLRSSRSKLFSSSSASLSGTFSPLPRPTRALDSRSPLTPPPQIGSLPPVFELFHRNTATTSLANENPSKGNLTGLPKPGGGEFGKLYGLPSLNDPVNKLGSDSNKMNPLRYKASGQDTNLLAGAGYGTRVWAAKGPVILGVNALMAKSFERSAAADTLGLTGHKRFMSEVPSKTSETKPYGLRPLSPHLPLYQPQLSSTLSIFNRIAGAFLASIVLAFYIIYMKLGLISLTYDSFYQFIFYSSKLHLLAVEVSALALSYHLYSAIRHLLI